MVPLPRPTNSSLTIYPLCTTIKQCGGCCGNANTVCKPTYTQRIQRKVVFGYCFWFTDLVRFVLQASHLAFANGKFRVVDSNVIIAFEEHTQCACQCRQTASDCSVNQNYEANSCRCVCRNLEKSTTCGPNRVWDPERCECRCPNMGGSCPIGFSFDPAFYCA